MSKKKVLVTGLNGVVGSAIRPLFEEKYELSSFSIMIAEKLIKKNINKDDNMKLINESIEKVNKINEA